MSLQDQNHHTPHQVVRHFLELSECQNLITQFNRSAEVREGHVLDRGDLKAQKNNSLRQCKELVVSEGATADHAVFLRLKSLVPRSLERYCLSSFAVLKYGEGDFYHWHRDTTGGLCAFRRFTIVVSLCSRQEYQGGELELETGPIPLQAGDAIIFPSHWLHRVTPIRSGVRFSLVAWVLG